MARNYVCSNLNPQDGLSGSITYDCISLSDCSLYPLDNTYDANLRSNIPEQIIPVILVKIISMSAAALGGVLVRLPHVRTEMAPR